jgi:predicted TIM-barrel fold metal-dependent hydrolase
MVAQANTPCAARFPSIDAHTHLGRWLSSWVERTGEWLVEDVDSWLSAMARYNVRAFVNLDGRWGDELQENLDRFDRAYPGRFATFCQLDWSLFAAGASGIRRLRDSLEKSARAGAAGLKVWKDLGLLVRDAEGALVLPDDVRLSDIWEAAGELGLPVWWHVADPVAFFKPVDGRNEYYEQLVARPDWSFAGPQFPSFERLIQAMETVVSAHPRTTFVAVHAGCYAENLSWVRRMLAEHPNFNLDIAARLAQLGRQPRATRELIMRYPDRVLFGTDEVPPTGCGFDADPQYARRYQRHFRFLETADEWFAHADVQPQLLGRWGISGLDLPDDVLAAVYAGNSARLLPQLSDEATPRQKPNWDGP